MKIPTLIVLASLAAVPLAGCLGESAPKQALTVRPNVADSAVILTVDAAEGLAYSDLLILVNDRPFRHGPAMDYERALFEVAGKDQPTDRVAIGDIARVPAAGPSSVELRNSGSGATFAEFSLVVADATAPAAPTPREPTAGELAVARDVRFEWDHPGDPSGVTYSLEYWPKATGQLTAPSVTTVNGIAAKGYTVPASSKLMPGLNYEWHVRAVDGAGNTGAWSSTREFTTSV